jgi:hypothetical protein
VALIAERGRWFIEQLGLIGFMRVMTEKTGTNTARAVLVFACEFIMALVT